jgi:outer membrane protein
MKLFLVSRRTDAARTASACIFSCLILAISAPTFAQVSLPAGPAPSQSTPSTASIPNVLTLDQAIHAAIDRNYTVRTSGNSARRDAIEVTRAKDNMWLPTVGANGSWNYDYSLTPASQRTATILQIMQGTVPTTNGDSLVVNGVVPGATPSQVVTVAGAHSLSWGASAGINLFNGGSDIARVHAAEASLGAAQGDFTWTRQQIAFDVTTDYLNVLRTGELVIAADTTLAEGMAQLRLVQGQYDAGVVALVQVLQQQVVQSQDSLALIQAINAYQNAQAQLLFVLNVPPTQFNNYTFTVAGIDTSVTQATRSAIDTTLGDSKINAAIDNRPDIQAEEQAIQARIYDIDVTRGSLLPSLDASAGIGGAGSNSDLTRIRMDNSLTAGLKLSIPIFDKFQNRLLIDEQEVDVENERITLEQDVQGMRNDATQAVNNLKAADLAVGESQVALTAAEELLRNATERLRVGAGTQVEVVIAEAAAETARANRVNAKYNFILAERQLQYTLGQWSY